MVVMAYVSISNYYVIKSDIVLRVKTSQKRCAPKVTIESNIKMTKSVIGMSDYSCLIGKFYTFELLICLKIPENHEITYYSDT